MKVQSRVRTGLAFRYPGESGAVSFREALEEAGVGIGTYGLVLIKQETIAGRDKFFLCSPDRTWTLTPGDYLLVLGQELRAVNEAELEFYFERED